MSISSQVKASSVLSCHTISCEPCRPRPKLLAPCTRARCQSRLSSEAVSRLTVRHAYLKIRDGHTTTQQHETHKMSRCILFGHDHQIDTLFLAVMPRSHHGINGGWLPACACMRPLCFRSKLSTCPACQTRPAVQGPLDRSERWRRSRPVFPEASRSPRSSGLFPKLHLGLARLLILGS